MNNILNRLDQNILNTRSDKQRAYTFAAFIVGTLISIVLLVLLSAHLDNMNRLASFEPIQPALMEQRVIAQHVAVEDILELMEWEANQVNLEITLPKALIIFEL